MGAAVVLVQDNSSNAEDSGYSFTTVIRNKHTGEVLKTIKYKQVLITLDELANMEENLGYEKNHLSHQ